MRILFSMRHVGFLRMYESVLTGLAARGHEITIAADRRESLGWLEPTERLTRLYPNIKCNRSVSLSRSPWFPFIKTIQLWHDSLRFHELKYRDTPKLRQRAEELVAPALLRLTPAFVARRDSLRRRLQSWLRVVERAIPSDPELRAFLEAERPDVVLVTPLVFLGSPQFQLLRVATELRLPTALCVGSWDHLSSKALIRDLPDRVFLWNEIQRREAIEDHNVPPERIVVTGAQCYDQWFDRQPSRTSQELARRVGLDPERPYLMYVGSALFRGSPIEAEFARRWVETLKRADDPVVRRAGILIRPHPARLEEWQQVDFSGFENVVVYGSNPIDEDSKNDYFDSLYHSAAIVGLNTSAFLEGAVVGRPVHTILLPEFYDNQEGTLHFRYLLEVGGGLLHAARSLPEHLTLLGGTLRANKPKDPRSRGFVEAFIRPEGAHQAATVRFLDAVEALQHVTPAQPAKASGSVLQLPLRMVAWVVARTIAQRYAVDGVIDRGRKKEELRKKKRQADHVAAREARREAARQEKAAEVREKQERKEKRLAEHHAARQRERESAHR